MDIEDIEKRLIMLEDRLSIVDKNMGIFGVYLETSRAAQEKLSVVMERFSDVIQEVKTTLVLMRNDINNNANDLTKVKEDVKELKGDVKDVDDKGKFDFIKFIRDNAVGFILGGGLAYILSLVMDAVIKKP